MSKSELARKAGISVLTVDRIEKGMSCRVSTMRKIILALGYELADKATVFPADNILQNKPHLALSACIRGEDDYTTIVKVMAALIAERVPVDLDKLYGRDAYPPAMIEPVEITPQNLIKVIVGGKAISPALQLGHLGDGRGWTNASALHQLDIEDAADLGVPGEIESVLLVGPMAPATKRGRAGSLAVQASAASRASFAAAAPIPASR